MVVLNLPIHNSDHGPILLKEDQKKDRNRGKRLKKFESFWLSEEKCEKVVYDAGKENEHIKTPSRINMVLGRLSEWAKDTFGDIKKRMRQTKKRLQSLQARTPDAPIMQMCNIMAADLNDLRNLQESYSHIRAKANEFRDGDKNTNYFHHKASSRKSHNSIVGLLNENNEWRRGNL
ncbi:G1/S-specific cyclin-E1 [Bienertia sinuspersici]